MYDEEYDPKKDYRRKADQEWEMAGLARQDGDAKGADLHTEKAKLYEVYLRYRRIK